MYVVIVSRFHTKTAKPKLRSTNIEHHYFVKFILLGQVHNKIGGTEKIVLF